MADGAISFFSGSQEPAMRTERDGKEPQGKADGGDAGRTIDDTGTFFIRPGPEPTGHYGFYVTKPSFVEIMRFQEKDTEAARRLVGKDDQTLVNEDGMFIIIRRHATKPIDLPARTSPRLSMPG
jgi:hypothetical protein